MDDWNCTTEEFFCFENEAYIEPDWDSQPPSFFEEFESGYWTPESVEEFASDLLQA
jgi:hypothetical protein